MTRPRAALLAARTAIRAGDRETTIVRRAGTAERPILRLEGIDTREAIEALRGDGPARRARGGAARSARTSGGPRSSRAARSSTARAPSAASASCVALPSCEVLAVERPGAAELLVPMVSRRDPQRRRRRARRIDVDLAFLGEASGAAAIGKDEGVQIDVVTLFPQWFDWFTGPAPRRQRAGRGQRAADAQPARAHAAQRRAGRRHAVRRRRRDGAARRRRWTTRCAASTTSIRSICASERRVIALTPGGRMLDDALVDELAAEPAITLLCGRYEGFDERIVQHFCSDAVSIGRYVLAGGELAAMVLCDAVLRKLPGALGPRRLGGARSPSALRSAAIRSTRTTRGRPSTAAGRSPTCCSPGTTRRSAAGAARGAASAARRRADRLRCAGRAGTHSLSSARSRGRPTAVARWAAAHTDRPDPRAPSLRHEHRHRQPRARPAAPGPELRPGRPRQGPLPGRRGHAPPHPGLRGRRPQAPGPRRARDLHGAQAVLRRRRRAHVPRALAEDRAHRGRRPR